MVHQLLTLLLSGMRIQCVVDNGFFGAAGYAYDESEMNQFLSPDGRPKQWLEYIHAKEIAE